MGAGALRHPPPVGKRAARHRQRQGPLRLSGGDRRVVDVETGSAETREHGVGRRLAAAHAVGDADPAVGRPRQREAGDGGRARLDRRHPLLVPDVVLRHGPRVAMDADEARARRDAEQVRQLGHDERRQPFVVELQQVGAQRAPDEAVSALKHLRLHPGRDSLEPAEAVRNRPPGTADEPAR